MHSQHPGAFAVDLGNVVVHLKKGKAQDPFAVLDACTKMSVG